MLLEHRAPDRHQMHDRENTGLPEEAFLCGAIIRIKAHHLAAACKPCRRAGGNHRVHLAAREHRREAGVGPRLIADPGRQLQFHLLRAAGLVDAGLQPADFCEIDALLLGEKAAHIDAGGLRPFRDADGAALEILRGPDAGLAAHVDRRVAMHPRRKDRDRDHGRDPLRGQRNIFAERQLGNVPFQRLGKAESNLFDRR